MHSDSALAVVADWIVNEHKAGNRYRPLPAEFAIESMADAYRIQAKLADTWSMTRGAMAGYKIALTSKPIQELCGINAPIAGRIYADTIHHGPAVISLQDFGRRSFKDLDVVGMTDAEAHAARCTARVRSPTA